MPRVVLTYGINSQGGWVQRYADELSRLGFDVVLFRHETRHFWSYWSRKVRKRDGAALRQFQRPGDHFVGHSAAALIWQESIESGAIWGRCIIFSGAATSDGMDYPEKSLEKALIVANPADFALKLGSLLPNHKFGKLGRIGYAGKPDDRFINRYEYRNNWFDLDHSHYGDGELFTKWVKIGFDFLSGLKV